MIMKMHLSEYDLVYSHDKIILKDGGTLSALWEKQTYSL